MAGKSALYWLLRAQEDEKRAQRIADVAAGEIKSMYRRQYLKIVKQLEGLKAQLDAGKELTRTQLWNYSRWRQLEKELVSFVDESSRISTKTTTDALEKVFERAIGTGSAQFEGTRMTLPVTAEQIINTNWSGLRYSERIWKNQAAIAERIKNSMEDMLVQGRGLPDIKKAIMREFDVAYNEADRLVRTEAAYVLNKANLEKYRAAGTQKVVWDAGLEDGRECAICKARADKVYWIDSAPMIPAHPRCRCIYSAVVEIGNENVPVTGDEAEQKIAAMETLKPINVRTALRNAEKSGKINLQLFGIKSSDFKTIKLPKDEYAMVIGELNTHLTAEERRKKVLSKAIGNHVYYFENNGFNNYRIFDKTPIDDEWWDEG